MATPCSFTQGKNDLLNEVCVALFKCVLRISVLPSLSCATISLLQLRRMMCQEAESPSLAGVQRAPISVMTVELLNGSKTVWISISVGLKLWETGKEPELETAGSAVHKSLRACFGDQTHRILQCAVAGHLVSVNAFIHRQQSVSFRASLSSNDNSWPFYTMNHWCRELPIKVEVKTRNENTGGKIPFKCQWSLQTQRVDTGPSQLPLRTQGNSVKVNVPLWGWG